MGTRHRRRWCRVRHPGEPGHVVVGLLDPETGEGDAWSVYQTEDVVTVSRTRYEELKDRLARLEAEREQLAAEVREQRQRAATALAEGRPVPVEGPDYDRELSMLEDAIGRVKADLADPGVVREYVEARMGAIQRERSDLDRALEPYRKAVHDARARLDEAERRLSQAEYGQTARREALDREAMELRLMADRAEESEDAREHAADPDRVASLLASLRAGDIRTVITGRDPDMDRAYELYEREKTELRRWVSLRAASLRVSGESPAPPECARHYSRERLRELTGARL